ncbi:hypothetical protein SGRIM119S_02591 [Streptomyces griseorubiginosus]
MDPDTGEMVSAVEVAETEYTAFTGRKKAEQITARLIVRRVRRLNTRVATRQGELFDFWRYHPVFTNSPSACFRPNCTTGNMPSWNRRSRREVLRARLPALGKLPGECRLTDPAGHAAQSAAGRRRPGLGLSRQGPHRHTLRPPDPRLCPTRPHREDQTARPPCPPTGRGSTPTRTCSKPSTTRHQHLDGLCLHRTLTAARPPATPPRPSPDPKDTSDRPRPERGGHCTPANSWPHPTISPRRESGLRKHQPVDRGSVTPVAGGNPR